MNAVRALCFKLSFTKSFDWYTRRLGSQLVIPEERITISYKSAGLPVGYRGEGLPVVYTKDPVSQSGYTET